MNPTLNPAADPLNEFANWLHRTFIAGAVALVIGAWGAFLRTAAGVDHQSRVMFDTASNATGSYASANYISLTENSTAPASGDVALAGELNAVSGGLNRAQATYGHTNGTGTTTLTKTFTKTVEDGGTNDTRTVAKAGLHNDPTAGDMTFSTLVTPVAPMVTADSVAVTWTFTF